MRSKSNGGFDLSFSGGGAFIPVELGWLPDWSGALHGRYKLKEAARLMVTQTDLVKPRKSHIFRLFLLAEHSEIGNNPLRSTIRQPDSSCARS
jgi:hypothetical protein